jgi:hypothetical protein
MSFQIEVLKVKVEPQGKFRVATVDHKVGGKVDSKRLVSFGPGKPAFDVLSQAQQGDVFDIDSQKIKNEKDGKEYWTWVAANSVGKSGGQVVSKVSANVRSSYETPEERAARQVYIVRQNSITNAIAFFEVQKVKEFHQQDVIDLAKQFEEYVFSTEPKEVE